MHPVGTKENTADIGTKPLSAKRTRLLLHWLGFQTSENEPVGLRLPAPATITAHGNDYFCDCAVIVAVILSVVCL